ncbi:hypothetical protein [Prosthecobacter sp.]|uniref:hypothetical protein n=1 Tax=Prosthecobacter sp. TaxID=1965333 RepID=UPI00378504FB
MQLKNKQLRILASLLGIIALIPPGLLLSSLAGAGILFVPLAEGAWGFYAQRRLRWGMETALWTLAVLILVIFIGTSIHSGARWHEVMSAPYPYQITALLGAPWIVGSLIGNAFRVKEVLKVERCAPPTN